MKRLRSFIAAFALLLLFVFLLPSQTLAQQGPGGFGGFSGVQNLNTTSISVQVRAADGSKLTSMAVVNLSNAMGQMVRSQTTFGSQTVFQVGAGAYVVEVEVFGYEKVRVQTEVSSGNPNQIVVVKLKPDTAGGVNYVPAAGVALSPKAQKELAKGMEDFQANKFDDAIRRLDAAHQLAPAHPDITYLLGTVYEKKNDLASARKYWDAALQADPRHMSSLLACGDMLLRQDDDVDARKYLDQAAEVAPNSWRAHSLLANALLRQSMYAEAVTHAERAMELGKAQASPSLLILGQALAAEHQNDQAIAALKDYLATKPPEPTAQAVEKLIARIKEAPAAPPGAVVGGVTYENASLAKDIPDAPLSAASMRWLPTNIDDAVPPTEPGVSCTVQDVVKKVSERVAELPSLVDRYAATEILRHEELNNAGLADHVDNLSFNYLASIREIKNKFGEFLDVQEYRNGSTGNDMFPDQMASTGLPSVVLIFHPWLISDFDMSCEGLSRTATGFAWQIHFKQKKEKESRIRQYRMGGHVYPVALKGRAYIDANTFQVVRLETDLRESRPDLRLTTEHLVMEYGPVQFKSRQEVLWLPASADYYAIFRGHRFHRRHSFADYLLFSIDDKQKLGSPSDEMIGSAAAKTDASNVYK
ncbi:MAG TPA: tetratricopeptide repeat protein [Candidatus Acidoferrum sp.]|nr:tetratricopeptide repeat protein [Candidatus Acidoferrum sp.]